MKHNFTEATTVITIFQNYIEKFTTIEIPHTHTHTRTRTQTKTTDIQCRHLTDLTNYTEKFTNRNTYYGIDVKSSLSTKLSNISLQIYTALSWKKHTNDPPTHTRAIMCVTN